MLFDALSSIFPDTPDLFCMLPEHLFSLFPDAPDLFCMISESLVLPFPDNPDLPLFGIGAVIISDKPPFQFFRSFSGQILTTD